MSNPYRIATIGDLLHRRYHVEDVLGDGGQAVVFKATDTAAGGTVAVKQLLSDPSDADHATQVARFRRGAAICVPHPRVVNPIDAFEDAGHFIVFPWIDGRELSRLSAPMPWREAVGLIRSIAGALRAVHEQGIVHRDIKPSNILVDRAGTPHLLDFGIARVAGVDTLTPADAALGSLNHIAPEQLLGPDVDGRADLYALGLVLVELLTGRPARSGDDEALRRQAVQSPPPPPSMLRSDIPPDVDRIVGRMCALDPADRYPDARELISELGVFACGTSPSSTRCLACGARITGSPSDCPGCLRTMGPGGYTLVRLSPPDRTHEYLVPDGQYLVGRDAIATDDLRVSRTQLAVGCGSDLVIRDAQAKNPTTLDGAVPSRTTPARQGQRIACAGHEFEIRCRSGSPTT